jgi:hypothetical protein
MPYLLGRIRNVDFTLFKDMMLSHTPMHLKEGLHVEHIWRNADDGTEVVFLTRADDLAHARAFIERVHGEALKADPHANLPTFTFLE